MQLTTEEVQHLRGMSRMLKNTGHATGNLQVLNAGIRMQRTLDRAAARAVAAGKAAAIDDGHRIDQTWGSDLPLLAAE